MQLNGVLLSHIITQQVTLLSVGKSLKWVRVELSMTYPIHIYYLHELLDNLNHNDFIGLCPYATTIEMPYFALKYGISLVVAYGHNPKMSLIVKSCNKACK